MTDSLATILGEQMSTIWSSCIELFSSMIPVYGYLLVIYIVAGFMGWLLSLLIFAVQDQWRSIKS